MYDLIINIYIYIVTDEESTSRSFMQLTALSLQISDTQLTY